MNKANRILILGIGNVLMGDEGVGVQAIRHLEGLQLPAGVTCLDGGTGGFHLLGLVQQSERLILIDATADGAPPGTVRRICPKFSSDYPATLTAHDIGLKDLLDVLYFLGTTPQIILFAVSIGPFQELGMKLSDPVKACLPVIAELILDEIAACPSQSRFGPATANLPRPAEVCHRQ